MENNDYRFIVTVKLNNQTPFTLVVNKQLTIGSDPRSDVIITDKRTPENLFEINEKHETLYLKYLGPKRFAFLNTLGLENGQNYFLAVGDKIKANNHLIEITEKKSSSAIVEKKIKVPIEEASLNHRPKLKAEMKEHIESPKNVEMKSATIKELPEVGFFELVPLKIYAFIFDFLISYLLISTVIPKFIPLPIKFFSETPHYLLELVGIGSNNSFLYFFVFLFLFNFMQSLILGTTLGQFFVGLKMDSKNRLSRMLLLRIKTFFFSLVMIPAQNQKRQNIFFKFSRYLLIPASIVGILAAPFLLYPVTKSETKTAMIKPGMQTINYQEAGQSYQFLLQRNQATMTRSTIENRFYLVMNFQENNKKYSTLNFIDLIEDQKMSINFISSFNYNDLNEILALGNPLYKKTNEAQALKDSLLYALNFAPNSFMNQLFLRGPFTGSANEIKKLFYPKNKNDSLIITNYTSPKELLSYDSEEFRYYFIFDQDQFHIMRAPLEKREILDLFQEQVFGNFITENLIINESGPAEAPKELTLLELFRVNTSQNPSQVLTYYINAVNKVLNTDVTYGQEKLNLDIKYLLAKSIEATLEVTSVYKDKLALQTLIHKLTPMEIPGEEDE